MTTATITGVKCGNHGAERVYHENAAAVRECYTGTQRAWDRHRSSAAQRRLEDAIDDAFDTEIQRREREESERVAAYKMQRDELYPGTTPTTADRQFVTPEERKPGTPVTQDGMYRNPDSGEVYKVQWNRGSGDGRRLYAKQLTLVTFNQDGTDVKTLYSIPLSGEKPGGVEHHFTYAPGAMRFLRAEWRMTIEDAKKFGALYGTCVRCGRTLTLEESIERAMGRICAKKENW